MNWPAPSGQQHEIAFGDQRATVVEVGGGLRSYSMGDEDVLDGYDVDEPCTAARGQTLIPWPNRIRDGLYRFGGVEHQLPLTEPATGNAIHGLVRWASWIAVEHEPARVVMSHVLHPQPGYPFALDLRVEYALAGDGLTVHTTATNVGAQRCPVGLGAHPYLRLRPDTIDELILHVPAATWLPTDERSIPIGLRRAVDGTDYDFRAGRPIGATRLDTAFTDIDGFTVTLAEPDGGPRVSLWADDSFRWLMLFTGDTLERDRRRQGLAVEPYTCPPNAFQTGEDVRVLEPGQSFATAWGIRPS